MEKKPSIILTEKAKQHFEKITNNNIIIDLSINKSGCSGSAYNMKTIKLEDITKSKNHRIHKIQNIPFLMNDEDIDSFENCILDYKKEGLNFKLVFDNPNTQNHCGCGESFALKRKGV